MNNKDNKKLKKLAILDEDKAAWQQLTKHFVKDAELVKAATISAGISTAVAVGGAVAAGTIGTFNGVLADAPQTMLASGLLAASLAAGTNLNIQGEIVNKVGKGKAVARDQDAKLGAFIAGATLLCGGLGTAVGAGTHKLTTSIMEHVQPKHQIEQTVTVEPMPFVDEIVIEK